MPSRSGAIERPPELTPQTKAAPAYELTPEEIAEARRLRKDFKHFARRCLYIRTKSGEVIPFPLNTAQERLHEIIEKQIAEIGYARILVPKARQLGISTYIEARFYWKLWKSKNALRAYILTHEQPATNNLFSMASRFQELHPPELGQPPLSTSNVKELVFADNQCGYQVATAGTREAGRSNTLQLFHGSEVAFWPNADSHVNASFDAVGDEPGTEIILESTGNGIGNLFHRLVQAGMRGQSKYAVAFIPWFWESAYQRECPDSFEAPKAWLEYALLHELTWEQLYWAYEKNRDKANTIAASLDEPCWMFLQEYPATVDECFQNSGDSFIPGHLVMRARRPEKPIEGRGPIILGVDPARSSDKIGVVDRCGRRMGERICEAWPAPGNIIIVANRLMRVIDKIKPDAVNIDMGGIGAAVFDLLDDKGYGYCINAVNFGGSPIGTGYTGDDLHFNRRAEMWDGLRSWFQTERGVQCPDDDVFQGDVCAPQWATGATRYNTSNELVLEEKDAIKKRLGASPDLGDAAALTFATPFAESSKARNQPANPPRGKRKAGY